MCGWLYWPNSISSQFFVQSYVTLCWSVLIAYDLSSVNAHAEELRSHFVQHEGEKALLVREVGTRHSVDFGLLAERMAELIDKNVTRYSHNLYANSEHSVISAH